jgi:hypothetical protein
MHEPVIMRHCNNVIPVALLFAAAQLLSAQQTTQPGIPALEPGNQPVLQQSTAPAASTAPENGAPEAPLAAPITQTSPLSKAMTPDRADAHQARPQAGTPHSMASDAWKGLILSLMGDKQYAEALKEIQTIPAEVRGQLEADIEFEQDEATLYGALGDTVHATAYLKRVEDYYILHRTSAPAGIEIQHAWLVYNFKDEEALYPVLLGLDDRGDLTPAQRADVASLWASWAVRRAFEAMDAGYTVRGVQILEAASDQFPDSPSIRMAVAAAYAKVGRAADALVLFKALPMQQAGVGDYQAAVGAALAAGDTAQAEAWLRLALDRFGTDAKILGLAARFEQATGNNRRAAEFWQAALDRLPPGATTQSLDSVFNLPAGSYRRPSAADLKRLLDPRSDPASAANRVPPLPAYGPDFKPRM